MLCAKPQKKLFSKSSNVTKWLTGPTLNKATQFSSRHSGYCVWSHEQNKSLLHSFVLFVKVPGILSILSLAYPSQQVLCFGVMMKEPTKTETDKTYYPCKVLLPIGAKILINYFKS